MCPDPRQLLLGMWIRDLGSMIFTNLLHCKGQVLLLVIVSWNPRNPSERWYCSITAGERVQGEQQALWAREWERPAFKLLVSLVRCRLMHEQMMKYLGAKQFLRPLLTKQSLFSIKDKPTREGEFQLSAWRSYLYYRDKVGEHLIQFLRDGIVAQECPFFHVPIKSVHTHTHETQLGGERTGVHHSPIASCSGQTPWFLLISAPILWDRFRHCLYLTAEEMESPTLNICNTQVSPGSKRQTHSSILHRLSDLLLSLQRGSHCLEISFPLKWLKLHS